MQWLVFLDGLEPLCYTLVEILYFGDMLLWNQMKLKIMPIVFGMLSSKAKVMASWRELWPPRSIHPLGVYLLPLRRNSHRTPQRRTWSASIRSLRLLTCGGGKHKRLRTLDNDKPKGATQEHRHLEMPEFAFIRHYKYELWMFCKI